MSMNFFNFLFLHIKLTLIPISTEKQAISPVRSLFHKTAHLLDSNVFIALHSEYKFSLLPFSSTSKNKNSDKAERNHLIGIIIYI